MPRRWAPVLAAGALALVGCGAPSEPAGEPGPRTLVLLTVDTLRADHLGAYGSDRGLTPNLDAWAEGALVFEAAYAPTPFTVPSLVSLLTGRHPLELGMRTNASRVADAADTLAEALAARGWKTAAVVSNVVLQDRPDLAQGFAIYDDTMQQREGVRGWPERIAADTTEAALRILDAWQPEAREPLLLWVHYQDPHGPYTPPAGFRERYLSDEQIRYGDRRLPAADRRGRGGIPRYQVVDEQSEAAFYHAGYDGEIAYLDQQVGRLLDALRDRGLADRVVFAADHGEAMGENDYWFAHGNDLTDALTRVPLIVRLPGAPAGRRADVVRLADLYPTLLSAALGAEAPAPAEGAGARDLLAPGAERRASLPLLATLRQNFEPRLGIVADDFKLILTLQDGVWTPRLYRRGQEEVDLAAPAPQVVARLRQRIFDLHALRDSGEAAPLVPLGEEAAGHLEALGYVVGPEE